MIRSNREQFSVISMKNKTKNKPLAEIGVFGGSGFYDFLKSIKKIEVKTPFGQPADKIALGEYAGRKIAFLPRHGEKHQYPPHQIPYRANLFAFKKLGVRQILAPCAVGSLQPKIKPGDFVICDQFIDRTRERQDTFFNGPKVAHISSADPYCPGLRNLIIKQCQVLKIPYHPQGVVVVIQGPRFSTKAESAYYQKQGWPVINMTQYPECVLARELEICYANISLVTDYDAGLIAYKKINPVSAQEVLKIFKANNEKVQKLILRVIENLPKDLTCHQCQNALKDAVL